MLEFQNVSIKSQPYAELLGVTFDDRLSFDKHVSNIAKKAGRQLNALKRIGAFLTERARLNVFKTFIFANFNYCPLVWHFCGANNTAKLEKIQLRGLRFVLQDFRSDHNTQIGRAHV